MFLDTIDRIRLPFRKEKEFYLALYNILGFYPHNISLYKHALLHSSVHHKGKNGRPENNERLEFLGDAILDAVVGDIVYKHFNGKREGFLTNTRSKLVQRATLGQLAEKLGINRLILSSGRTTSHNSYMGGNAFEALVGAVYLDRGYDFVLHFMQDKILGMYIDLDKMAKKEVNFKSKLLEWTQKNRVKLVFDLVKQTKDANSASPMFEYKVIIEGVECGSGKGYTKKESQQAASKEALQLLRKHPKDVDRIFAAKSERTRMEEMPTMALPDITVDRNPIVDNSQDADGNQMAKNEQKRTDVRAHRADANNEDTPETDDGLDFNLSDITMKRKSHDEIIAEAEAAAYASL
ncbi:MAG: ribonuclease III [Bacteroidaceae bacterium]|nr:ribonuclease III [Bacteroidaceae bacterium]